jgi:GNAT superfamily N-acetyltransferase
VSLPIEIRQYQPKELRTLIAVAARAFWDDPMFNFFMPDLLKQHQVGSGFFEATIGDCAEHGTVSCALVNNDPTPVGVAALLPPGVAIAHGGRREAVQLARVGPAILKSPQRVTAVKLLTKLQKHHLTDEHWYLSILATDPRMQGKGVGTKLLEPFLARADDEGMPMYLETQKESNLGYYARFGFEVREILHVGKSPNVWTMSRKPR